MHSFLRATCVWLAVLLACAVVHAQEPSNLTPPVALGSTDVAYPAGGTGDASVVLELTIEKDGSVSSARVVEGNEPFGEQARSQSLGWRFEPARRKGTPVAARVRARVEFRQENVEPAPVAEPSSEPAAGEPRVTTAAKTPPPAPPLEITVLGERREIGQTTLSEREVRELPGAFGDAFRAVEIMPGVTPLVSGVPYFYVRGAPPNNSGYFVDGIRVPVLFHLGLAQSVIHPGLIAGVDFFPSAAPARYGGFAGGIIAGRTREPASTFHGEANLRLIDAGALVEAPFAGDRGSALVAGRYGYPGPILEAVSGDVKLGYWDYQARTSFRVGNRDTLGLFVFGSHDYLAQRSPSGDPVASQEFREQFVSDMHRLDLRYDHALTGGRVRFAVTGGYDRQGAHPTYMQDRSLGARLELEQRVSDSLEFRGGAEGQLDDYRVKVGVSRPRDPLPPVEANPPPTNFRAGLHADFVWKATPRVEIVPGTRLQLFTSSRSREPLARGRASTVIPAVDPRLATRVTLLPGFAWLTSFGLAHQYPSLRLGDIPAPLVSVPGFPLGRRQLQSAAQVSQGFEAALPLDLLASVTGFYSRWAGLTDLSAACEQLLEPNVPPATPDEPLPPVVCPNADPVHGRAYGVELTLRRPFTKRLGGFLSYTLSRATREAHFRTPAGADDLATVVSDFDRTHVLNFALSYDFGRGWRAGSRLLFYTGTPYSRLSGSIPVPPYNAYRHPAFYRVDFRLEKRWRLSETGAIAFVLEGQNVTLSREVTNLGLECEGQGGPEGGTNGCEPSKIGPITLPSVGVEAFF
jgi:TonB family protein